MARIQVPVNPRTRVPQGQPAYERNVDIPDNREIVGALNNFTSYLARERQRKETFEVRKALADDGIEQQRAFEASMDAAPAGAPNFATDTLVRTSTVHEQLMEKYRGLGYSDEALDILDLGLRSTRAEYLGRAIAFQGQQEFSLTKKEAEDFSRSQQQLVYRDYNNVERYINEFTESLGSAPIPESEKQRIIDSELPAIRMGAARGFAENDPKGFLSIVDPGSLPGVGEGYEGFQGVAAAIASEFGFSPEEVAAVFSYETGGTFNANVRGGADGTYLGLIQFNQENQTKYGITENSSPEDWTRAISKYMKDRGFKPGMSLLDFYSTINAGTPGRHNASDGNGTVREHVDRMLSQHLEGAKEWLAKGAVPTEVPAEVKEGQAEALASHPLLSKLTPDELAQARGWAKSALAEDNAGATAAMEIRLRNAESAWLNTGTGPEITLEELSQVYTPAVAKQKFAEHLAARRTGPLILQFKTQSPAEIDAAIARLKPTDPNSETYAVQQDAYDAALKAKEQVMAARKADPAAYVVSNFPLVRKQLEDGDLAGGMHSLNQMYEKLGIPAIDRKPFTEEQARQEIERYKQLTPQQKLQYLGGMKQTFGPLWKQAREQLAGGGIETDALVQVLLQQSPAYRQTAQDVLLGLEAIKVDPNRKPRGSDIGPAYRDVMGNANVQLNPLISKALGEAAAALYVQQGGSIDNFDRNLYERALRQAVGGSANNDETGIVQMGPGATATILPPGITQTQMETWFEGLTLNKLRALSIGNAPPVYALNNRPAQMKDIIDDGTLVMYRFPGQYVIQMAGDDKYLLTPSGRPFIIRVTPNTVRQGFVQPPPSRQRPGGDRKGTPTLNQSGFRRER